MDAEELLLSELLLRFDALQSKIGQLSLIPSLPSASVPVISRLIVF